MEPMRNDPRYHRGPCPVPTPAGREHIRRLIAEARERLAEAGAGEE